MTEPLIIHMEDVRRAHMCSSGARAWFARYNLDWSDFLRNGIPAETLEALCDPFADTVVKEARNGRK